MKMKSIRLLLRFLTVGGLVLLLLIPLMMIRGVVHERQAYRGQAVARVAQNSAGAQTFIGPMRVVSWTDTRRVEYTDDKGAIQHRIERTRGQFLQMPRTLVVEGDMQPRALKVGLYRVGVYEWHGKLRAAFEPALPAVPANVEREYGTPYLAFGMSDVRGLVGMPVLRADGRPLQLLAGTGALAKRFSGMHAPLPAIAGERVAGNEVAMDFVLKGTQSLAVAPLADDNRIHLASAWPHPRFEGYSPRSQLRSDGFTADWEISSLASNVQAQLQDGREIADGDAGRAYESAVPRVDTVGVSLVDPVDIYTKADRASKYGLLFVVLTFVGFALFELIKRLPIHPLQYLLVGLALAIFFLLLLSLSEHIAFLPAYLLAAGACIGLQFVYLSGVLRSRLRAAGFAAMLTALYGVLYGLLVSEDNALLMGSLLLFGILAAIMWITRKVDWYELGASLR